MPHFSPRYVGPARWAALGLLLTVTWPSPSRADIIEWINSEGGLFTDPQNWLDSGGMNRVPVRNDVARFAIPGSYAIQWVEAAPHSGLMPVPRSIKQLLISSGDVTWNLGRHEVAVGAGSDSIFGLWVGEPGEGDATLRVLSGTLSHTWGHVGYASGSLAQLIASGPQSRLVAPRTHWVESMRVGGTGGVGILELRDGAEGEWRDLVIGAETRSQGHLVVSGAGTKLNSPQNQGRLWVGYLGTGSARFENGCSVQGDLYVGYAAGATGAALAAGPGTVLNSSIFLGEEGYGEFEARDGATINGSIDITPLGDGVGIVRLLGSSTLVQGDSINMRANWPSSILIGEGAEVQLSGDLGIAGFGTDLRIDGAGTTVVAQSLAIGPNGEGNTGSITGGAHVRVLNNDIDVGGGSLRLADPGTLLETIGDIDVSDLLIESGAAVIGDGRLAGSGFNGGLALITVTGPGSTLQINGPGWIGTISPTLLTAANDGVVLIDDLIVADRGMLDGPLHVVDWAAEPVQAGVIHARELTVNPGAIVPEAVTLLNGGVINGISVIPGSVHNFGGTVTPAIDRISMEVLGDFSSDPSGSLTLVFNQIYENVYSRIDVSGSATIGGTLRLVTDEFVNFVPGIHHFTMLTATDIAGQFDTIVLDRPLGVRLEPEYTGDKILLHVVAGMSMETSSFYELEEATAQVTNAAPNSEIWLFGTFRGIDQTRIEFLDTTLDLKSPQLLAGPLMTDGSGNCTITFLVPLPGEARTLSVQSAQFRDTSKVIQKQVRRR